MTISSSDTQRGEIDEDATSGAVTLEVTLSESSTETVTVAYATADFSSTDTAVSSSSIDPATAGADYTAASGTLTFAAGETRKTITVAISDDVNRERDELFKVGLSSATGGATIASSGSEATILIDDDDPLPKLTVTASVPGLTSTGAPGGTFTTPEGFLSVAEGDSGNTDITFTVTLEGTDYLPTVFSVRSIDGSATGNEDYRGVSSSFVIAAGQTTGTVTLSVVGDENYEPDETLFLEFNNSRGVNITNSADGFFRVEVTITNDDAVMATSASNLQARPAGSGNLAVSWSPAFSAPNGYSVRWRKASESDTALSAVNTVTATSYTITGLDNDTSYHVRLDTRNLANDGIASGTSLTTAATPTAGAAPTVTAIANQSARVGELFAVDVDATPGTAGDSLQYQAASSAPAVATVTPTALTAHSASSKVRVTPVAVGTATITVTVSDGTEVGTETFDVTANKGQLLAPIPRLILISQGSTGFTITWDAVDNATGYTATTVAGDVTVPGAVSTSGTRPEAVFTGLTASTLYTVSVTATGSANYNDSAAARLRVRTLRPALILPRFLTVNEGATGTYAARLFAQPTADVTVAVTVDGSADVSVTPASLTFTKSNWNTLQMVTVTAAEDTDMVDDTATLNHAASGGDYDSVTGSLRVTVDDDEALPIFDFAVVKGGHFSSGNMALIFSTFEEEGTVEFAVSLSAASTGTVTVEYATEDIPVGAQVLTDFGDAGPATAGEDYTATSGTLTFAPGETRKTFSVDLIDETLFERSVELFHLKFSNPSGAIIRAGQEQWIFNVIDGDPVPSVSVMAAGLASTGSPGERRTPEGKLSVAEGDSGETDITFTVTQPQVVSWRSVDAGIIRARPHQGATAASFTEDFEGTPGTLSFAAGETQVKYTLKIKGDTDVEGDEIFHVQLGRPDGIVTNSGEGDFLIEVTIVDDDGAPSKPRAPRLTASASGQLTVRWAAPADDGGQSITDYDVRYRVKPTTPSDSGWVELADTSPSTALMADITGLADGTAYQVQVRAENENSNGAWSDKTEGTPVASPSTSPTAEYNAGSGALVIRNVQIGSARATDINTLDHNLQIFGSPFGSAAGEDLTMTVGATSIIYAGLPCTAGSCVWGAPSTTRSISAGTAILSTRYRNLDTSGTPALGNIALAISTGGSRTQSIFTGSIPITLVQPAPAAPGNLMLALRPKMATLSWSNPGDSSIIGYQYRVGTSGVWTKLPGSGATTTSFDVFDGLTGGSPQTIQLRAMNASGNGASASVTSAVPAAPTGLTAVALSASARLRWADPDDPSIIKYQFRVGTSGTWTDIAGSSAASVTGIASGLTNGSAQDVFLRAVNFVGAGTASSSVSVTPVLNRTPTLVFSETSLTVNEGVTGTYTVRLATEPTANVTVAVTVDGSTDVTVDPASLMFTNLDWDLVQTVTVTAAEDTDMEDDTATLNHAASGGGYDSLTGSVTVTVDDDEAPPTNSSPVITDITGKSVTFGATLKVDVDATDADTGDTLIFKAASDDTGVVTVAPTADTNLVADSKITLTPVAVGTATITVTVSDGTASPTDTFVLTVDAAKLATPTDLALKEDSQTRTGFTITWTAVSNATGYTASAMRADGMGTAETSTVLGTTTEAVFTSLTAGTDYKVTVTVIGSGNYANSDASAEFDASTAANMVPTVANVIPAQAATLGTAFEYIFPANTFNDADGDSLTYTAMQTDGSMDSALPTWLVFTAAERKFTVAADAGEVGTLMVKVTASDGMGGLVSDTFDIVVSEADTAPAFADSATIANKIFTVDTEITAFTLPEATGGNDTISYALTPDLPTGLNVDTGTRMVSGTPTAAAAEATYTWRASDGDTNTANSDSSALTFMLTVNKATLAKPTNLALKANSSTRTGFTVTWDAVENAAGYTATATQGSNSFTGTVDTRGTTPEAVFTGLTASTTYTVTVTATGDANYAASEASDGFEVTTTANQIPTVGTAIPDQTATVDTAFEYIFPADTFSDADSDSLTYTATKSDDSALSSTWLTFTASERKLAGTPQAGDTGTLMVKVTASDGMGGSVSDTFNIVVSEADTAPAFADSATIANKIFTVDTEITAFTLPEATGGNDTISYALTPDLPAGLSLNESTREVSGTPTAAAAAATYTWRASDGDENTTDTDSNALTFMLTVNKAKLATPSNLALKANSKTRTDFTVTWDVVTNAAGYTATAVQGSNTFTGTVSVPSSGPEAAFTGLTAGTTYTVTVTATGDANYSMSEASDGFDVTTTANQAPTVGTAIPDQTATVDTAFEYIFPANTFNDADGDGLTYTATKSDDSALSSTWLTFTASERKLAGTPQAGDIGTLMVKVTANDGMGGSISDTFNIVVSEADTAPAFADSVTIANKIFTVDTEITAFTLPEATGGNDTINYALTPDLPTGLNVDTGTRMVSGTPTAAAAAATYTWRASDSDENTADTDSNALTFMLTVNKATLAKPSNLELRTNSKMRTGFTVTWDVVTNAAGYTATAVQGSNSFTGTVSVPSSGPEAAFSDLTAGTTYTVTVTATGDANYSMSDASDGFDVTTVANQVPTVGTAIPDQTATVDTAFEYSFPAGTFSDADSDSLTYTAQQTDGTMDSALPTWLTFTDNERKFAGTPQAGDTGTLMVKVSASDGMDSVSDTFNIVVSAAPALVFTPTALTVDEGDSGTYTVALATQPTATVTVTVGGTDSTDVTVDTDTDTTGNQNALMFTTMNWNTAQTVTVSAAEDTDTVDDSVTLSHTAANGGYGSVTGNLVVSVMEDVDNRLTTPTVTLIVGDTWLRAVWPANIGLVASSELQWKASSVTGWSGTGVTTVTGTSATPVERTGTNIIGLTTGTTYEVRVRDKAVANSPDFVDSNWSSAVRATPKGIPAPTGLVVEDEDDTALTLRWTPPADTRFTGYEINQDDGGWEPLDASMDSTDVRITGLTNEQSYSFRLRAVRAVDRRNLQDEVVEILGAAKILGAATPSVSGMPGTRPRAPEMLTAESGDGQVKLTWKAPSFGGTPTGYEVSSDGGKTWTATDSTDLSYTVTGLTNGQGYVFLVRAVNAIGTGSPSASASATPRGVPSAPTGLEAAAGNGEVKLTWTAHPDGANQVEGVTLLRFEYTTDSGTTWTAIEGNPTSKASHVVTGLTNGQEYIFQLRAVNSVGNSAASKVTDEVKATPTATGNVRFPAPVTGLTVTATAQRELTATWMVASHAPGGYELRWRKVSDFRGADSDKKTLAAADTSHKITGLDPGTDYIVTIVTLDSEGAEVSDTVVDRRVATLGAPTLSYPTLPTTLRAGVEFAMLTPTPANFATGSTYTYAVTTGDLPSGLAFDTSTGAISGTPDRPKGTRTSVTVTVTGTKGTGMSMQTETATATLDFPRIFRFRLATPTVTLIVGDTWLRAVWPANIGLVESSELQWKASSVTGWTAAMGVTTVTNTPTTPVERTGTDIIGLTTGTDVRGACA